MSSEQKQVIRQAADHEGLTMSAFLLSHGLRAARRFNLAEDDGQATTGEE